MKTNYFKNSNKQFFGNSTFKNIPVNNSLENQKNFISLKKKLMECYFFFFYFGSFGSRFNNIT